ncbi:arsenate reductase/protein-tyrosine-phosphatase family protein [Candidatus Harpocratesius sp.]
MASIYKNVESIGIVCMDNTTLSPVAAYLFRDLAIKSRNPKIRKIRFFDAGYKRTHHSVSNSAKGFLQQRGFGTTDMMETHRVNKNWLVTKDIIFVMDRFLQRDLLYDFFPTKVEEMKKKILILNEAAGIDERIRDTSEDFYIDVTPTFLLIERCCIQIIKIIERENR